MNSLKREFEEDSLVVDILKNIGAIETCPIHDDWYRTLEKDEKFTYGAATNRYKKVCMTEIVPSSFRDKIKIVLEQGSLENECPFCGKFK